MIRPFSGKITFPESVKGETSGERCGQEYDGRQSPVIVRIKSVKDGAAGETPDFGGNREEKDRCEKKDVKDLRESPSREIIEFLAKKGADVSNYDPLFPYLKIHKINLQCQKFSAATFKNADCVVIVTDHTGVDYDFIVKNSKLIVDTRNVLKRVENRTNIVKL